MSILENFTLNSPSGFWNPIVWLIFLIIFGIIGYLIYSRGNRSYKPNTDQVKPFLSGNEVEDVEEATKRFVDVKESVKYVEQYKEMFL